MPWHLTRMEENLESKDEKNKVIYTRYSLVKELAYHYTN